MTGLGIAHQRLINLGIARSSHTHIPLEKPEDVVHWLCAVQAQDFAGAKWALGLRLRHASDAAIEHAFNEGTILRTHLLRPTWHFVTPADICWMLALTSPRVHAVNATYYRRLDLDQRLVTRCNDLLAKALHGGKQLTRDELRGVLEQAGIDTRVELRMNYILMHAELDGIICSGPRRGKQFTYMLLDERAAQARTLEGEEALAELVRRYFVSRGPATVQDFAKWSGLTIADGRRGLEMVRGQLRREVIDGEEYWLPPTTPKAEVVFPVVTLLSVYDEYLSSYKDRSSIVSPDIAAKLSAMVNALYYVVVVDGQIVGTWKRGLKKSAVVIEMKLLKPLTGAEEQAIAAAAQEYGSFLGLPVVLA